MTARTTFSPEKMELVIFDLDGTLVDSSEDIAHSINHALEHVGLPSKTIDQIKGMIGSGTKTLVKDALEGNQHLFETAFAAFSGHYSEHLLDRTKLYDGVLEILEFLKDKKLAVLSNKRQKFCDPIIDGLKVRKYFKKVMGGDALLVKKPMPDPILHICKELRVDPSQAVMVGDSSVDIESGLAAGAWTIGLTKGFCPRSEIEGAKPHWVVDHVYSIRSIFMAA